MRLWVEGRPEERVVDRDEDLVVLEPDELRSLSSAADAVPAREREQRSRRPSGPRSSEEDEEERDADHRGRGRACRAGSAGCSAAARRLGHGDPRPPGRLVGQSGGDAIRCAIRHGSNESTGSAVRWLERVPEALDLRLGDWSRSWSGFWRKSSRKPCMPFGPAKSGRVSRSRNWAIRWAAPMTSAAFFWSGV